MKSRIEKYYKQDLSDFQRVKKNNDLYKSIYGNVDDFDNLPISDNYVELDISDIKNGITSREEYKKAKEYGNITNKRVKKIEDNNVEVKEDKIYDINKMLENARINNKLIKDEVGLISDKYLKSLEEFTKEEKVELIKEKQEMKEEYNKELEDKMKETASLSLDILSDLKPSEDTVITTPIKEELIEEKEVTKDDAFYSGTYSFSKEDFEEKNEDFSDLESSNVTLKIVFLSFGILICVAMIILGYYYMK